MSKNHKSKFEKVGMTMIFSCVAVMAVCGAYVGIMYAQHKGDHAFDCVVIDQADPSAASISYDSAIVPGGECDQKFQIKSMLVTYVAYSFYFEAGDPSLYQPLYVTVAINGQRAGEGRLSQLMSEKEEYKGVLNGGTSIDVDIHYVLDFGYSGEVSDWSFQIKVETYGGVF